MTEIEKHKFNVTVLENQFREKVSDYHVLSKTFAELDKKNDSDGQLLTVLENLNKKYCIKMKLLKKEIERLGGNVDGKEEKCDINHKFQDKSHVTPKKTKLVEDLIDKGHGKVEKVNNGTLNEADMNKAESLEANDKKPNSEKIFVQISQQRPENPKSYSSTQAQGSQPFYTLTPEQNFNREGASRQQFQYPPNQQLSFPAAHANQMYYPFQIYPEYWSAPDPRFVNY